MGSRDEAESKSTYKSPIRQEQARLTRRRVVDAARTLFLQNGYARTKLRQIAEEADVSEQTIYAVYKNKRGLLLAIIDDMDMQAGVEQTARDLAAAEGDAQRQLSVFVGFDRRLFERERHHLAILRDVGSSDPEMAVAYRSGRDRARQIHLQTIHQWERDGALDQTLTADEAADIYHAVSSVDTFEYLVDHRDWSPGGWEQQTFRILASALLRDVSVE